MEWSLLPEPAITCILGHLPFADRCRVASVSQTWYHCFSSPSLWKSTVLTFTKPENGKLLDYADRFGGMIEYLTIEVDQYEKVNRDNACRILKLFTNLPHRKLISLTVAFVGENPIFYSGAEFVEVFKNLFTIQNDQPQFTAIDLNKVKFSINEELVDLLTENNPNLEKLHIQSDALICKVSPDCVKRVLGRCRLLRDVSLVSISFTEEVLRMFAEVGRAPLHHLSLMIRSEQKFAIPISSEAWSFIRTRFPDLRVSLGFDSTCPMDVILEVLKPEIPVYCMKLAVYGPVEDEMNYLPIYYKDTVETLIVHPMNNVKFQEALLDVCRKCKKLRTLLVYCVLPSDLIAQILELCPEIRSRGTYILKSEAEPEWNWIMAKDAKNVL